LPLTALASLTGRPQMTLPLLADGPVPLADGPVPLADGPVPLADGGPPLGFSLLGWRGGDEALLATAEILCP
jgi:hypothetical protein